MSPYWNRTGRICEAHEADPIEAPEPRPSPWTPLMWLASVVLLLLPWFAPYWLPYVQAWGAK